MSVDELSEIAWGKLSPQLRERAVARLRYAYDPEFFEQVRALVEAHGLGEWLPSGWHFAQGMHVRNVLRSDEVLGYTRALPSRWRRLVKREDAPPSPISDSELPPLPEYYGEQCEEGNWDDYYVQCIEAAAGLRGDL